MSFHSNVWVKTIFAVFYFPSSSSCALPLQHVSIWWYFLFISRHSFDVVVSYTTQYSPASTFFFLSWAQHKHALKKWFSVMHLNVMTSVAQQTYSFILQAMWVNKSRMFACIENWCVRYCLASGVLCVHVWVWVWAIQSCSFSLFWSHLSMRAKMLLSIFRLISLAMNSIQIF